MKKIITIIKTSILALALSLSTAQANETVVEQADDIFTRVLCTVDPTKCEEVQ